MSHFRCNWAITEVGLKHKFFQL